MKKFKTIEEIKPNTVWTSCDGAGIEVTVVDTKIGLPEDMVHYKWIEKGKEVFHSKSCFSFQVRYYLKEEDGLHTNMSSDHLSKEKEYDVKMDELHFINQIIKNLKHLEHLYKSNKLLDEKELFAIENHLASWYYRQEKVGDELNDMKGYGSYVPTDS
jgi:hypothetical protein